MGAIGSGSDEYEGVAAAAAAARSQRAIAQEIRSILAAVSKATTAGSVATGEAIQAIKLMPFRSVPNRQQLPFVSCWVRFNSSPDAGQERKRISAESSPSSERVKIAGCSSAAKAGEGGIQGDEDSERLFERESVSVWMGEFGESRNPD